ncbi:MAG: hypothetical protein KGN74_03695 [Gemmatimonadota bacterium]|nr:hypothetical protein [Gemmatimonadota bacterium]
MSPERRLPRGVAVVLWAALGAVALVFAVQGGEYSTLDLLRQHRQAIGLRAQVDSLQHVVDSLGRYRDRVLHDPQLQERIGREEFGWVRGNKEMLYRFVRPDSASR